MCPRGWKAAESSNRDSLPHALHGKSSEIKGFVCAANNKDCSQFITCQRGKMIQCFLQTATFAAITDDFSAKPKVDNLFFFCSSACVGEIEQSLERKQQGVPV